MLVGKQLWVCMWSGERIWWLLCCALRYVYWIGTQGKAGSSGKTLLTMVLFEDGTCSILLLYFGQLECCGWTVSCLVLGLSWIQIIIALQPAGADMHKSVSINPPHAMPGTYRLAVWTRGFTWPLWIRAARSLKISSYNGVQYVWEATILQFAFNSLM